MTPLSVTCLPRTIGGVLREIARLERDQGPLIDRWVLASDRSELDSLADAMAAADNRISDLRAEARQLVEQATGVSFEQLGGL